MTEKESSSDCNSINFGEFKREEIDKIMINGGYEKDPKENEWVYKPKDTKTKKKLYLPKNKGRLEKEKEEDIINNIKNKGLNPNARDFVPRSKEKANNTFTNQAPNQVFIPMINSYYIYPSQYMPYTRPNVYYQMGIQPVNFIYGYSSQEGMIPPNRMEYEMENPQPNGGYIPVAMTSAPIMPNIQGGKINDNKDVMPMNEGYMNNELSNGDNDNSRNNVENEENQDVIIDIEESNEDLTENQNNDNDEIIQNENHTENNKEDIESKSEEMVNKQQEEESNEIKEQKQTQQQKKKQNNKEKSVIEEQTQKVKEIPKSNEVKKQKSIDQTKKNKELKESSKNSYASKVESGTNNNNKKKSNDKKKNNLSKITNSKDNKIGDSSKDEKPKEEKSKEENEIKEIDKEIKTEEINTNVTEVEKKEEKKEEVKKEEVKVKTWASLFDNDSSKSNVSKTKTNKVTNKNTTTKTVPKNQSNTVEPVNLNDKIKISFDPVKIQPRGLVNNGNICFMNAILQPLLYCAPFYNFINSLKKETVQSITNKPSIIESMIMFIDEFKQIKKKSTDTEEFGESFLPQYLYDALRNYSSSNSLKGRQEDAEEYLGFLLNGIHDEFISKYTGSSNNNKKSDGEGWMEVGPKNKTVITREAEIKESPINRIFGGKIKSILKSPGNKQSATYEPFLSLQLDITPNNVHAIEDALENLTIEETVPDYIVNGVKVVAKKQNLIDGLPNVLLLHLKCFTFDHNTTQKVQKQIDFKPVLIIKPELVSPTLKNRAPYKYNLFAVVNHHGKLAGGGHYTCDVKLYNNRWLSFDDTKIQHTSELEVITPNKNQLPYLLLYTLDTSEQKKIK